MYLVLIGAPGAGKGTQANPIARELNVAHVATGDMFRSAVARGTPTGKEAKAYLDAGALVPDAVTIAMLEERLAEPDAQGGAILDGFPRNVAQAQALDDALRGRGRCVGQAIYLAVPRQELLRRLSGRWLCRNCQASYHEVFSPPREPGKCDRCGGELYQRSDDTPETAERRLQVYFDETLPVIAYYRSAGVLEEVDGNQSIDDVREAVLSAVQRRSRERV
jgi:adenylate kinase